MASREARLQRRWRSWLHNRIFVDGVPEPQIENVTELRVCLASKWLKKHALWVPIPNIGVNTSRHNIYLYAIEFMKEFGTHYNKINHNCQDFMLWFLRSLGIPKPFRTAMGKLELAGKIAVSPVFALSGMLLGAGMTVASPIAVPIALLVKRYRNDPNRSNTTTMFAPLSVILMPAATVYELLLEDTPEELERNRQHASSVGINLVELQLVSKYKKFFSDIYWVVNHF